LKLIGGDGDLGGLPDVVVGDRALGGDERRDVVIDRRAPYGGRVHTTECHDLDEVKRLIGLEDRLAAKKIRYPRRRRAPEKTFRPEELMRALKANEFTAEMSRFVRAIGRQYVFDDSRRVRDFKAVIEHVYTRGAGRFDLTSVCFGTIRIRNGWSLVLTPSIQMFCAHRLLLEPQARVRRIANVDISFNVSEVRVVDPLPDFATTI
jgi:hypothetical protein